MFMSIMQLLIIAYDIHTRVSFVIEMYVFCFVRDLELISMAMMNIMRGSGPKIRGVGGAECTTVMDPSMRGSGLMTSNMDRDCYC